LNKLKNHIAKNLQLIYNYMCFKGGIKVRKFFSLVLVLVVVISSVSICFAANNDVQIPDTVVPAAPSVTDDMYEEQTTFIDDADIPEGSTKTSTDTVEVGEQTVPAGSSLPKTGGIPAELFYAAGGMFIVAALVLTFAKKKAA